MTKISKPPRRSTQPTRKKAEPAASREPISASRGRPRKGGETKAKKVSVSLLQETYDFLLIEGEGVVSQGIERVVHECQTARVRRRKT